MEGPRLLVKRPGHQTLLKMQCPPINLARGCTSYTCLKQLVEQQLTHDCEGWHYPVLGCKSNIRFLYRGREAFVTSKGCHGGWLQVAFANVVALAWNVYLSFASHTEVAKAPLISVHTQSGSLDIEMSSMDDVEDRKD